MTRHGQLPVIARTVSTPPVPPPVPRGFGEDGLPPLVDATGRVHTYLRMSLTDRCDLACTYCRPPSGGPRHARRAEMLRFEEVARVVGVLGRMGIRRVRLTGGEPLVRRNAVGLVERLTAIDGLEVVMTTNATRLASMATDLARAGLRSVNVSLDTLDPARFARLTAGGDVRRVVAGIEAALDAGLPVKLNTVPLMGVNEDELGALVDWAWARAITPRFIELMPMGAGGSLDPRARIPTAEVVRRLGDRVTPDRAPRRPDRGPARYLRSRDGQRTVGFISALSERFCEDCNRLRITSRGELHACIASGRSVSLREVLRGGGNDRDVAWTAAWALSGKDAGHGWCAGGPAEPLAMCTIGG